MPGVLLSSPDMKLSLTLSTLLVAASAVAQNPFAPYRKAGVTESTTYFAQKAPFTFPFSYSKKLPNADFDLEAFVIDHPVDTLRAVEEKYDHIAFDPKKMLYAYPFPIRPEWDVLPYPFVKSVPGDTSKWIPHFATTLKEREGFRALKFHLELDKLTHTRAYDGNQLFLLKTPESLEKIIANIETAKDHVFISSYLFHCDEGSQRLLKVMKKRAAQGLRIFVLYDAFGAKSQPSCKKTLEGMGVNVLLYKAGPNRIFHEKMSVFDGESAIIDGQNIIAAGTLSTGVNNLFNDVAVGVRGPVVSEVANRFIKHWSSQGTLPQDLIGFYSRLKNAARPHTGKIVYEKALAKESGQGLCRVVSKTFKKSPEIRHLFNQTAKTSTNYLFFNYIDPRFRNPEGNQVGEEFLRLVLENANTNPNLRVDLLTNGWKDPTKFILPDGIAPKKNAITSVVLKVFDALVKDKHKELALMRKNFVQKVESEEIHWWEYAMYMHAKTLMADNIWTIIGSHNLNPDSENKSSELVIACLDSGLAKEMQRSIITDALNSIPVPLNKR